MTKVTIQIIDTKTNKPIVYVVEPNIERLANFWQFVIKNELWYPTGPNIKWEITVVTNEFIKPVYPSYKDFIKKYADIEGVK